MEIKYQGYNSATKEMIDLKSITPLVVDPSISDGLFIPFTPKIVLRRFTGIKDRAGKGVDVYDGDIIGRTSFADKVIIWKDCGFYFHSVNNPNTVIPLTYLDEFDVVIGNIYQNPELIETKKESSKMSVDTSTGYIEKPKPAKGYKIERYYCECGCKQGYWHYVKISKKKK